VLLGGVTACGRVEPAVADPQPQLVAKNDGTQPSEPTPNAQPGTPPLSRPKEPDKATPEKAPAKPETPPARPKTAESEQKPEPKQQSLPTQQPEPKREPVPEPNLGGDFLALSRDGKTLVSGDATAIRFWSVPDGKVVRTIAAPKDYSFTCLALSRDDKVLATGTNRSQTDNPVVLWDAEKCQIIKAMNPVTDTAVVTSVPAQGRFIGPGVSWMNVKLPTGPAVSVALSPDGKTVVTAGDGMLHVYSAATGRNTSALGYSFPGGPNLPAVPGLGVWCAVYTPDGKHVISGGTDGYLRWWDTATGKNTAGQTTGIAVPSLKVTISPDGKTVASWSPGQKEFRLWDVARGTSTQTFTTDNPVFAVAFSPDGKTVASGGGSWGAKENGAELKLWTVADGKTRAALPAEKDVINSVVFGPDGKTLISQSAKDIKLWNVDSAKCVKTLGR
jgi:WD40 repeat protein